MSMEKWEGPLGIFDNIEDRDTEVRNAALVESSAVEEFGEACRTFLRSTRGLKLKPGSMNMHGRQAWNGVLQALAALERYDD